MVTVSVLITCYKSESVIHECIDSLLSQSYDDYEIIVVEDPPFDRTKEIISSFKDNKIRYFRNSERMGLSESRNITIKESRGKYLFFTDSDCIVSSNWIETGLKPLLNNDCLGVEGKIIYVSEDYQPTYSDRVVHNLYGKEYMTANIAYKRDIIEEIGGFDKNLTHYEDREISIRVLKKGNIIFNPEMIVIHQKDKRRPELFLRGGSASRNIVKIYKKHKFKLDIYWRVMHPFNLMEIFFPPILLLFPFKYRYRTWDDWILLFLTWPRLVRERFCFWDQALKERVFLI